MENLKKHLLDLLQQTVAGPNGTCAGCGSKESDVYYMHTPQRATFHTADCPIDLELITIENKLFY